MPQHCHVKTIWSYGQVSCNHLDFSHVDSTRNLNTTIFVEKYSAALQQILAGVESSLRRESGNEMANGDKKIFMEWQSKEREYLDASRVEILRRFWEKSMIKHLETKLREESDRSSSLATQRSSLLLGDGDFPVPKFACVVEVVSFRSLILSRISSSCILLLPQRLLYDVSALNYSFD